METDRPGGRRAAGSWLFLDSESRRQRSHEPRQPEVRKRKKSDIHTRLSCKIDYLLRSNHNDQSIASEFFTGDSISYRFRFAEYTLYTSTFLIICYFLFFCRFGFRGPSICSGGVFFKRISLDAETCFMNFIWASLRIARSTIASSRSSRVRSSSIRSVVINSAAFPAR